MNARVLRGFLALTLMAAIAGMAPGCKSNKDPEPVAPVFEDDGNDFEPTTVEGLPDIDYDRLGPWSQSSGLQTVYFDYDSSSLRPDALDALRRNADLMKGRTDVVFQVAGHCDERGTQEYNLALGERRALTVRDHLISLGVSGNRILTISYGEEMPEAMGGGESAYSRNRRAEFNEARQL